jgi:CheY-like chemotaxis protein
VQCAQRADEGFLDKVVGEGAVAGEEAGEGAQVWQQGGDGAAQGVGAVVGWHVSWLFSRGGVHGRPSHTGSHHANRGDEDRWMTGDIHSLDPAPDVRRAQLLHALPYARRYARALTGSQRAGDALVSEALADLLARGDGTAAAAAAAGGSVRANLYARITRGFDSVPSDVAGLAPRQRQLLLLTSLEELPLAEAASILGMTTAAATAQLTAARERLMQSASTDVLIVEDEPVIAMDIEELVRDCGHRVVGVAVSETEAVEMARRTRPGLILADINLGAGGDGAAAVARIMQLHRTPVIFVTAYPERLLTGEALEPAFVITKPFEPLALAIATYQAVTGGLKLD